MARETIEYIIPTDLDDIPDGTTYKRLSSTEQTKLGTVEDSATADQSGAEIKTAYEGEENAFTDTKNTKLTGIDENATVDQDEADIKTLFSWSTSPEDGATADQTGAEVQTAVLGLDDGDRVLVGSEPQTGEKKVYGVHINASGHIETDQDTVAES